MSNVDGPRGLRETAAFKRACVSIVSAQLTDLSLAKGSWRELSKTVGFCHKSPKYYLGMSQKEWSFKI